jgi:hypothetical protein
MMSGPEQSGILGFVLRSKDRESRREVRQSIVTPAALRCGELRDLGAEAQ